MKIDEIIEQALSEIETVPVMTDYLQYEDHYSEKDVRDAMRKLIHLIADNKALNTEINAEAVNAKFERDFNDQLKSSERGWNGWIGYGRKEAEQDYRFCPHPFSMRSFFHDGSMLCSLCNYQFQKPTKQS
jgi:hypothetical protein